MLGARWPLAAGVRLTSRVIEATEALSRGRPAALVLPAASLLSDARLLARLRDTDWWPSWQEWAMDGVEVGLRSLFARDSADALPAVVADLMSTGVMAGFQATAGTEAVPVPTGATEWPPQRLRDALAKAVHGLAPLALAITGHVVGERARGRRPALKNFAHIAVICTGTSVLAARYRDHVQRRARHLLDTRLDDEISREQHVTLTNARTAPTPGHDFAKTLVALGQLGDDACANAGRRAMDTPRRLVQRRTDGTTLRTVIGDLPVYPPDAGRMWIPSDQVRSLKRQMSAAESAAPDGSNQRLEVLETSFRRTRLEWLGQEICVETDPPTIEERFHLVTLAFMIGASYKVLPMVTGTAIQRVLPGVAMDVVAAWVNRHPQTDPRSSAPVMWAVASTLVQTVLNSSVPSHHGDQPEPLIAATANCTGAAMLWATQWDRLDAHLRALAVVPVACWTYTMSRARPQSWQRWMTELCYVMMPALATWQLSDRLDAEAALLNSSQLAVFTTRAARARQSTEAQVLAEYRAGLGLARDAIDRLGGSAPKRLLDHLTADCDELEAWLDSQVSALGRPET